MHPPGLMYLVDACLDSQSNRHWYLHALKLADGTDHVPPVNISGSVSRYAGAGTLVFYPAIHLQRPALLQLKSRTTNTIFLAFSRSVSEEDKHYHGWVFAYDGKNPEATICLQRHLHGVPLQRDNLEPIEDL
jgi:hypothetical protein